jgi:Glutamate 5-kinase
VSNLVGRTSSHWSRTSTGLHEADPRRDPGARRVAAARADDEGLDAMVGPGAGRLGRGGMATKLRAARLAARAGAATLLIDGRGDAIERLQAPDSGTLLAPDRARMAARKRWIAGQLQTRGELVLDAGAVRVLREAGRSLLPVGVLEVRGRFARGEVVVCRDEAGVEVARGLVNYSSREAERIRGCTSGEVADRLGYAAEPELVHRDNLVLA